MANQPYQVVSVAEAARIIGCTDGRVRQLLADGSLTGRKLKARAWLIFRDEVERFAANRPRLGRPPKQRPLGLA